MTFIEFLIENLAYASTLSLNEDVTRDIIKLVTKQKKKKNLEMEKKLRDDCVPKEGPPTRVGRRPGA